MTYRLELNPSDHRQVLSNFLQKWTEEHSPDLKLVPSDGSDPVEAPSLQLYLHSPTLRSVLSSMDLKEEISICVLATSSSLSMLLQLLSTGFVIGASRKEIDEVKEAAKALGVILGDCQKTGADSPPIKQEAEEEISKE